MRVFLLVLILLLGGIIFIPLVNAENESDALELNISSSHISETTSVPLVSFDGFSESKKSEIELKGIKKNDLGISSSIKKYDILIIDIPKMREQLANNETIIVRINGIPYKMNLHESSGDAIGLDPAINSYFGILDNDKNSNVALTISDKGLLGWILLEGINYHIGISPTRENEKSIEYVYSSADVVSHECVGCLENDYLSHTDSQELSQSDHVILELKDQDLEQQMAVSGPVDVKILVVTDSNWIDHEQNTSGWYMSANQIFTIANSQLSKSDIEVNLIPIYDESFATDLANDPEIDHIPLDIFMKYISTDYLDSKSADLAFYLGGFDCDDTYCYSNSTIGATYGYDNPNNSHKRYAWGQMVNTTASGYSGDEHDRTVVTLHEIGHLFDGDHEIAPDQNETYNRAYTYTDTNGFINRTVISAPDPNTGFDYSSINNHGNETHDNARRINETKGVVANYYPDLPTANFTATPTSGPAPLTVQFNDTSTGSPTAWEWNFGDEDVTHWSPRSTHSSVALPNGTIVLMGGYYLNDTWRSTDKGVTWTLMNASSGWSERTEHAAVALPDNSIVLMGGRDYPSYYGLNDTWRSTDMGATWALMNASSGWQGRQSHTSVTLPDKSIVLIGGNDPYWGTGTSDVWRSTDMGATWTLQNASSDAGSRTGHSAVALPNGSIVIIGGNSGYRDVWLSADKGKTWTPQVYFAPWMERTQHTSVALPDGSILLMGGKSDGYLLNDVWRSMDQGKTWTLVNASNVSWPPRYDHTSVILPDGTITVMGGYDSQNYHRLADIWQSADNGSTWTQVIINATWASQDQNPDHIYQYPGSYTVRLNATNNAGSNLMTKTDYITVGTPVIPLAADFTAAPTSGSVPLTVQFIDTSTGSPTGWIWDFGDGDGTNGTEQNPVHTYQLPGTFTVSLTATKNGDNNTVTKNGCITVTPQATPPTAGFIASPTTGPASLTVTFIDQSSGQITSWLWDADNDGNYDCYTQACEYTFTDPGTYSPKLLVSGDGGFDNMTRIDYITVTPPAAPPAADFTGTPTTGTAPLTVMFTDLSTNTPTSWSWNFGDNSTVNATQKNPLHTYSAAGIYTVSMTATNAGGSNTKTRTNYITVTPSVTSPVANFTGTPTSGTSPLKVQFTDHSTNTPASWNWNFGDNSTVNATQKNPLHTYSASGIYTVSMTATNAGGSNTKTRTNYIIVGNVTQIEQNVGSDTIVKFTGEGATLWTPPAGVTQVEYLVVAGGGSGGGYVGGGGGGGGIKNGTGLAVSGAIPVTVGAGGSTAGTNGGDSGFGSIIASGGGHGSSGGGNGTYYATTGGSGGGGGSTTGHVSGAAGLSGNGNRGGNSSGQSGYYPSGGGGGAGAPGNIGNRLLGGNGGAGLASSITGTSLYYGGGGGGGIRRSGNDGWPGSGGSGGGGSGGANYFDGGIHYQYPGSDGTNGLGGGGGGGGAALYSPITHKGGSGIVIIRYVTPT